MGWKQFDNRSSLKEQVEQHMTQERERLHRRTDQRLNEQRQRALGIEYYIWRSQDDDKVRTRHADYDDRIFRWDTPPPGGHPGHDFGCRCWAEPYLTSTYEGPPDLPIEPVYPEFYLLPAAAALRALRTIVDKTGERLQRWQTERLARQTTKRVRDILMPNGKPIGKKGNRKDVRVINGGTAEAKKLFEKLGENGKENKPLGYPGKGKRLPNGDWIGYRPKSKHGEPAIDLDVEDFPYNKIKFPNE